MKEDRNDLGPGHPGGRERRDPSDDYVLDARDPDAV